MLLRLSMQYPRVSAFLVGVLALVLAAQPRPATAQDGSAKTTDQASPLLHYQGRLTGTDGEPVPDADHTVVFRLYAQEEGGTAVWQETQNLSTSDGVFSARLGSVNGIEGLEFDRQYWLGISVDGGEELTPRTRLAEVPYAMNAYSVAGGAVDSSAIQAGAVTEGALASQSVSNAALQDEAVSAEKVADRAIGSDELDYGAVDSAAIDPNAVFRTLDPTLEVDAGNNYVGINRSSSISNASVFDVQYPGGGYGGMYVNTEKELGWPFYGYATGGTFHAWHHYDHGDRRWRLIFDGATPETRLEVTESAVLPGGDDEIALGSDSSRWSTVYAADGVTQTFDRRLKTGIESLDYGLEEVLRLEPVSYRWKDEAGADGEGGERRIGLVAQQVRKVVDEVVKQPQDGDGYLGMNYSELIPVLVRAVQQQQKIIERQGRALRAQKKEKQDEKLRARIDTLENRVRRLVRRVERRTEESRTVRTASGE